MGEVYRVRDTKLDRDVAIKVLPEDFATDQERPARFEHEGKLLASLTTRTSRQSWPRYGAMQLEGTRRCDLPGVLRTS